MQNKFGVNRPLLNVHRFEIRQFVRFWKLPIYSDQSNQKTNYLRNKIRKQLMPTLRIFFNPQIDTVLLNFVEIRKNEHLYFQNVLKFLLKPQECHPLFSFSLFNLYFRAPYFTKFCSTSYYFLPSTSYYVPRLATLNVEVAPLLRQIFDRPKVGLLTTLGLATNLRSTRSEASRTQRRLCLPHPGKADGMSLVGEPSVQLVEVASLPRKPKIRGQWLIFNRIEARIEDSASTSFKTPTYVRSSNKSSICQRLCLPRRIASRPKVVVVEARSNQPFLLGLSKMMHLVETYHYHRLYKSKIDYAELKIQYKDSLNYFSRNQILYWLIINNNLIKNLNCYPNIFQKQVLKTILKTFNKVENVVTTYGKNKLSIKQNFYRSSTCSGFSNKFFVKNVTNIGQINQKLTIICQNKQVNEKNLTSLLILKFTKKLFISKEKRFLLLILRNLINKY